MKIKIRFDNKKNAVTGTVTGWRWEKSSIKGVAEKVIAVWCEGGVGVGKPLMLGLRFRVVINGNSK
ncbi:hypothetical protein [Kluyvera intermedia]|uniref:Uncharacterized protein n=1 Tax=Kluyvera intermedia TaxID=61648 RepID=A0AA95G3U1_KLUIN|nr:hypothetical protein [Kluyvera intermedia]WGL57656.1 hypothetical protein QBD33_07745 [Kluyvera intermedia]